LTVSSDIILLLPNILNIILLLAGRDIVIDYYRRQRGSREGEREVPAHMPNGQAAMYYATRRPQPFSH